MSNDDLRPGRKRLEAHVDGDLRTWLEAYARQRGWTLRLAIETAIASFREEAAAGVPDPWYPESSAEGIPDGRAQQFAENAHDLAENAHEGEMSDV